MPKRNLCSLVATTALLALSAPAGAATFVKGPFITGTATAYTGFETIGPHGNGAPLFFGPYVEHGIRVEHIGGGGVVTTYQHLGNYGWYAGADLPGYTSIRFNSGALMSAVQFDATTELLTDTIGWPFHYQLLRQGSVVATGTVGDMCSAYTQCFRTYGFTGDWFDEVRLQASILITEFDPQGRGTDVMSLDNIYLKAVPEPATWAMMIGGFALAGGALRTRRRLVACPA
jgi:hypothetical protein